MQGLPLPEGVRAESLERLRAFQGQRVVVVTPVYNDWESFGFLVRDLHAERDRHGFELVVLAVDDGSDLQHPPDMDALFVRLTGNVGHQRALAIGLAWAFNHLAFDVVIVMDADGEDRPADVPILLAEHREAPLAIVVAGRARRSEGTMFRVFYQLYKDTFRILIGRHISFGNFALIPQAHLNRLLMMPELWNHLAATYMRSRLALRKVALARGTRYAGQSKMNTPALVMHGLSALSVFSDILVARVLLASVGLVMGSFVGVLTVVCVRLFTDLAIAGWATNAVGLLIIISMQALLMSMMSAFILLSGRAQIPVSLTVEYPRFVRDVGGAEPPALMRRRRQPEGNHSP